MYELFSRVPPLNALKYMRDEMSTLVKDIGTRIVNDPENIKVNTYFLYSFFLLYFCSC